MTTQNLWLQLAAHRALDDAPRWAVRCAELPAPQQRHVHVLGTGRGLLQPCAVEDGADDALVRECLQQ